MRLEEEEQEERGREGETLLRLEVELTLESVGCRLGTERKVGAGMMLDSSSSSSTSLKGRASCRLMMSTEESWREEEAVVRVVGCLTNFKGVASYLPLACCIVLSKSRLYFCRMEVVT